PYCFLSTLVLHAFPTRRSSDLVMPWSSKAQDLLRQQYAPTGAAARAGLAASIAALRTTSKHVPDASELTGRYEERRVMAEQYVRSEEHTSELQSRVDLVCRLLL